MHNADEKKPQAQTAENPSGEPTTANEASIQKQEANTTLSAEAGKEQQFKEAQTERD